MPIAARCVFECEGEYRSSLEIPFRIAPATIATRSRGLRSAVHADVFIRTMSGEAPGSSWRVFLWPFNKAVNRPLQRNGPSVGGTLRPSCRCHAPGGPARFSEPASPQTVPALSRCVWTSPALKVERFERLGIMEPGRSAQGQGPGHAPQRSHYAEAFS